MPDLLRARAGYYVGAGGRDYHLDGPETANNPVVGAAIDRLGLRTFKDRLDWVNAGGGVLNDLSAFLDSVPSGKPWFFWLGLYDPHLPWTNLGPRGLPDPSQVTVPPYLPDLPGVRSGLARYIGEVESLDVKIGAILKVLDERGLANDTVVVFMGDNGMSNWGHGKGTLYDPGLHVPFVVRWPGVVQPATSSQALISGEDLTPTLLEMAGVEVPRSTSGVSFAKVLRNQPFQGRKYVFAQRMPYGGDGYMQDTTPAATFDLSRAIRSADFKLIFNLTPHRAIMPPVGMRDDAGWLEMKAAHKRGLLDPKFVTAYFTTPRPTYELYDLRADPGELNNLYGKAGWDVFKELCDALTEKMVSDYDFLPTPSR